jgi:hypothetical protein
MTVLSWFFNFVVIIIFFLVSKEGADFARAGAVLVIAVLVLEFFAQKKYKSAIESIEHKHANFDAIAMRNNDGSQAANFTIMKFNKLKKLDVEIRTTHLNILVIAIFGTFIWGFGDILFDYYIQVSTS